MNEKQRTSISDIPVCNQRLYIEVGKINKITPAEVKEMVEFVGSYTAGLISKGTMEAVMIPYFGKFRPKVRKVLATQKVKNNERSGHDLIYRALTGMPLIDKRNPKQDDIIPGERGTTGGTEQDLDTLGPGVQSTP